MQAETQLARLKEIKKEATSLPIGFLVLVVVTSLCGIALLKKKKLN